MTSQLSQLLQLSRPLRPLRDRSPSAAEHTVSLIHGGRHASRSGPVYRRTVNSDDPADFGGYMTETYPALAARAGLTLAEILLLARNSFSAAWLTSHALDGFLGELDAYAAEHGASEAAAQSGDASHRPPE